MYKKIAIVGAGPMGCSLAALTSPSIPTVLVVRDAARAKRIRASGIRVAGMLGGFGHPEVVESIEDLATIDRIDLLFIATNTTAISNICESLRPHVEVLPHIVSYQNGIEPGRALMRELGAARVLRMVCTYGATFDDTDAAHAQPSGDCADLATPALSVRIT